MFIVGYTYARKDIYSLLSIPEAQQGGDWLNGYHRHGPDYFIFCNVGVPGRTGHDYNNHWDGEKLIWYGKNRSHFGQQAIQNLISGKYRVFVFYRDQDRAPFTYAGIGKAIPHESYDRPARIDWVFGTDDSQGSPVFTDEYMAGSKFKEGQRTQVFVNRYERDRRARDACIHHLGAKCKVCQLDFGERYGELGEGFIHVHHIVPVSDIGQDYVVDPVTDLVPVCPNCHAMIHRTNPPLSIGKLRELLRT